MKNVYLVSLYVSESIICTKCMHIGLVTKIVEDYVRTYVYIYIYIYCSFQGTQNFPFKEGIQMLIFKSSFYLLIVH